MQCSAAHRRVSVFRLIIVEVKEAQRTMNTRTVDNAGHMKAEKKQLFKQFV
jgi:hypothetical protein